MGRPQPLLSLLAQLSELQEVVQGLAERVAKTEDGIANARKRLTGTFARKGEYEDMRATLNQLIADKPILEQKLGSRPINAVELQAVAQSFARGYGAGTDSG